MKDSLGARICCLWRWVTKLQLRFPTSTTLNVDGVEFRSSTAWPTAADIPLGTGIDWYNSTANALRHYVNQGGTVRYISFTT